MREQAAEEMQTLMRHRTYATRYKNKRSQKMLRTPDRRGCATLLMLGGAKEGCVRSVAAGVEAGYLRMQAGYPSCFCAHNNGGTEAYLILATKLSRVDATKATISLRQACAQTCMITREEQERIYADEKQIVRARRAKKSLMCMHLAALEQRKVVLYFVECGVAVHSHSTPRMKITQVTQ